MKIAVSPSDEQRIQVTDLLPDDASLPVDGDDE